MSLRFRSYLHNAIVATVLSCIGMTCGSPSPSTTIDDLGEFIQCYRGGPCGACSDQFGCAECDEDSDCPSQDINRSLCVFGHCSRCRTNADCDAGMACSPKTRSCEATCASSADCGASDPVCVASHVCVDCASDIDCPGERPLCDEELGRCSECVSENDCAAPTVICDRLRGMCAECMVDEDCQAPGKDAYCDIDAVCQPL